MLMFALLALIVVMGFGGGWLYLRVRQPAAPLTTTGIQSNGSNDQNTGTNNGTMTQTNK
jgi:hypothetical protein